MSPDRAGDRVEIQELISRFNRAADEGIAIDLADTFVEDGVFDGLRGSARGRTQLMAFVTALHSDPARARSGQHVTHNVIIDFLDDRTASLTADLLMVVAGDGDSRIARMCRYEDDLIRTADGWRFQHRRVSELS